MSGRDSGGKAKAKPNRAQIILSWCGCSPLFDSSSGYLAAEVLELVGNAALDNKRTRIILLHLLLAIRNEDELNKLLSGVTIAQGDVLPNI
ncbi:hypothetical protein GQX74_005867 [Glossina fuscipes]|nr:hypothetical protein GQX74_005867 [Glossina fuscipes]